MLVPVPDTDRRDTNMVFTVQFLLLVPGTCTFQQSRIVVTFIIAHTYKFEPAKLLLEKMKHVDQNNIETLRSLDCV